MHTVTLNLPETLHRTVCELAARDQVSVDQFIASALNELISADYLERRAARADRTRFLAVLAKVPNVAADSSDRL